MSNRSIASRGCAMPLHLTQDLSQEIIDATEPATLFAALQRARARMGFDHFALNYDLYAQQADNTPFLLHDYPDAWAKIYVEFKLAGRDPVRRACDKSITGFAWHDLSRLIPLSNGDRQMLSIGQDVGLANGFTVARHLPGEASGSCSFAVRLLDRLPQGMLLAAELIGALALAAARRMVIVDPLLASPQLTDRQRECVLWAARGKTAYETGLIMGISMETVVQHLKLARARCNAHSRQQLTIAALFHGFIGFRDIFPRWTK